MGFENRKFMEKGSEYFPKVLMWNGRKVMGDEVEATEK